MKEAEEREGGRERGRGGDVDLLERGGRAFFGGLCICYCKKSDRNYMEPTNLFSLT